MTQIENWQGDVQGDVSTIDHNRDFNDWLITPRAVPGGNEAFPVEDVQPSDVTAAANPSAGLSDADITSARFIQPGDHLYRLPNGGVILRRNVFLDRCLEGDLGRSSLNMSSAATASAIDYFHNGRMRVSDGDWCQVEERTSPDGSTIHNLAIPPSFNLSNPDSVKDLRRILREIRAAQGGTVHNSTLDASTARQLASAVPAEDLTRLENIIDARITANMNPIEYALYCIHQQPWYVYVPADLVGGGLSIAAVAAIFHYVSKWLQGPPPPPPPGGPGIPELIDEIRGLRQLLRPNPTGDSVAPEVATGERSAFQMNSTAYWVGAVGAATLIAGIFHFAGRTREAEVREGEVRVGDAEVRVRDIAAHAPAVRPRIEVRDTTTGGGIGYGYGLLGARPALAH